jgi:hypothetical protein
MTVVAPTAAPNAAPAAAPNRLVDLFEFGLDAPICLTWELTYACNLSCVHCLSSSGRRDPRELSTADCKAVIDELARMQPLTRRRPRSRPGDHRPWPRSAADHCLRRQPTGRIRTGRPLATAAGSATDNRRCERSTQWGV